MKSPTCLSLLRTNIAPILQWINARSLPNDKQIHEARVAVKTLRAGLALMRPWVDGQPFAQALQAFGHYLSLSRDTRVACRWLDTLIADEVAGVPIAGLVILRDCLAARAAVDMLDQQQLQMAAGAVQLAFDELPDCLLTSSEWKMRARHFADRLCVTGASHYLAYARSGNCEPIHNWRKQVKRVYYQQMLLKPFAIPTSLSFKTLRKMGAVLGEAQDFCVLETWLDHFRQEFTEWDEDAVRQLFIWQRELRLAKATALQIKLL